MKKTISFLVATIITMSSLGCGTPQTDPHTSSNTTRKTHAVMEAWTGDFSEDKLIHAINEYENNYTSIVVGEDVTSVLSFETDFEVSSCSVTRLSKVDHEDINGELNGYIDLSLETYYEGKTVTVSTGWWHREHSSWVNDYTTWSYLVCVKDMDGVEHYYYFRVLYIEAFVEVVY